MSIDGFESSTEASSSGTREHVLTCGTMPDGRNRRQKVELCDRARFSTVIGEPVNTVNVLCCGGDTYRCVQQTSRQFPGEWT